MKNLIIFDTPQLESQKPKLLWLTNAVIRRLTIFTSQMARTYFTELLIDFHDKIDVNSQFDRSS